MEGITFSDQNKNLEHDEELDPIANDILLGEITEFEGLGPEHQLQLANKQFFTAIENFIGSFVQCIVSTIEQKNAPIVDWLNDAYTVLKCNVLIDVLFELREKVKESGVVGDVTAEEANVLVMKIEHDLFIEIAADLMAPPCNSSEILEFMRLSTAALGVKGCDQVIEKLRLVESLITASEKNTDQNLVNGLAGIKVFDFDLINDAKDDAQRRSRQADNLDLILKTKSEYRGLARVDGDIAKQVLELEESFPNFASTVEYAVQQIALSSLTQDRGFAMQPVLLAGPPGVGKTAFVQALANIIGVQFKSVDMASMTSGFVIGGSSYKWAEGSEGLVLTALRTGQHANPIVLLDEIDKVGKNMQHDPLGPLYSLLEHVSSKEFVDEAVGVSIDASNVVWVATANNIENIPKPILSRFMVVQVDKAKGGDARKVVKSVWTSICLQNKWGAKFNPVLSDGVVDLLADKEPREMKRQMLMACGRVAQMRPPVKGELLELTVFDIKPREEGIRVQMH